MAVAPASPRKLSRGRSRGPERFFYDRTSYTGVHRHGGAQIHDAEAAAKKFNNFMQARYTAWEVRTPRRAQSGRPAMSPTKAVHPLPRSWRASRDTSRSPSLGATPEDSPGAQSVINNEMQSVLICHQDQSHASRLASSTSSATIDRIPSYESVGRRNDSRSTTASPPSAAAPERYGPERFFYDRNTYTGTHRFGGPCVVESHVRLEDLRSRYAEEHINLLGDDMSRSDSCSPSGSPSRVSVEPTQTRRNRGTPGTEASLPRSMSSRALRFRSAADGGKVHRSLMLDMGSSANNSADADADDERFAFWREAIARLWSDRVQSPSGRPDRKLDSLQSAFDNLESSTPTKERKATPQTTCDHFRYGPERFFYDQRTYTGTHRLGRPSIVDM